MKIIELNLTPIAEIPYLNAGRRPSDYFVDRLPVHLGKVDRLPENLSAMVVTADLQGREDFQFQIGPSLRLLGEWLPAYLKAEIFPMIKRGAGEIGVVLAGDFYTVPTLDKRGGTGDVTTVWQAFGHQFSWVAGVAGNHDLFTKNSHRNSNNVPAFRSPLHFLDLEAKFIAGLRIAGISGIVGDPKRTWRKTEDQFERFIYALSDDSPDILVMHDGPDCPRNGFRGSARIREALRSIPDSLIVRGHAHWKLPLIQLPNGPQVLNVDARVVILTS